ncbi:S-type pyocin domain-containing protein [Pseudomonas sp. Irchel 3F5]|uniref:S-type pyocin domain-containing protein n=1 Tax=Pseudomonas sp. Irchel 3F5 TaxID=2009002 RepID=UPI002115B182|nr:S-type pyocin domain-containing protein [Pseudomonas sp. Irchel 3F5]
MRAEVLGLRPGQNLQALADAGGMAIIDHRLKTEQVAGGTAIHVAATGGTIAAEVPVRNAVLDPLSNTYVLDGETPGDKSLRFVADPDPAAHGATAQGTAGDLPGLLALGAPADSIPLGADLRIDDCIVCIPGQSPLYFTFAVRPVGSGVVNGTGQAVTHDWWEAVEKDAGAPVPMAVGERFRGREFTSFASFESALWRAVTEEGLLISQLDEINRKRLANGYAPYARKSDWLGERHECGVRHGLLQPRPYKHPQAYCCPGLATCYPAVRTLAEP